jgi:serine/threonine protein phosphatase PrpC
MGQSKTDKPEKKEEPAQATSTATAAPAVKEAPPPPAPKPEPAAAPAAVADKPAPKEPALMSAEPQATTAEAVTPAAAGPQLCPVCQAPRKGTQDYCDDCGWLFKNGPPVAAAATAAPAADVNPGTRLKDRYELIELFGQRQGVSRFRGYDYSGSSGQPTPVIILRAPVPEMAEPVMALDEVVEADEGVGEDMMPTFEDAPPMAQVTGSGPAWPSIGWEKDILDKAANAAVPAVVDAFVEGGYEYLVEEAPQGRILWDAWDDPDSNAELRYGWLKQVAEGLAALHKAGALLEGVRPDFVTVTDAGQAMVADLSDLLPLPLPPGTPVKGGLYTAPELILTPDQADARATLYSFGAMLYSLEYTHHALEEKDFVAQFSPKLITDRYPDVHPGFFRMVSKTFVRDVNTRFPTDEASKVDPSGFSELINQLDVCRKTFDPVRFDIAAWTTTGMVRTGNEDAFALMHAIESRQDEFSEYAVVLLADGMGGYEAGEVAAAMCIQSLRRYLLKQPMFAALAGEPPPEENVFNVDACKQILKEALRNANKDVFTAARTPGKGRRGMGCTAEAVYIDGKNLVSGHVGDSRVYHLHNGQVQQLTRDQTLVNRLVELGTLTPEEAEDHPRKNELQQAIGGQPDVEPGLYSAKMKRGDWVVVCSDGLSNHIPNKDLEMMMLRETAGSAEEAARRLINLVNLRGATDNATIVVVRAM